MDPAFQLSKERRECAAETTLFEDRNVVLPDIRVSCAMESTGAPLLTADPRAGIETMLKSSPFFLSSRLFFFFAPYANASLCCTI